MTKKDCRSICYVGSPALFTKGASAIHMMKMCQAISRSGMNIELVFPDFDRKRDIFEYYGIQDKFDIKTIPFTNIPGRQIIHGIASAIYARRNRDRFDYFITRNIVFTYLATCVFGLKTIYDAHHPLVNAVARYMFDCFKNNENLLRFSTNTQGLADMYIKLGIDSQKVVVAHNGVELEKFRIPEGKTALREELSLDPDKNIICYSGNTYRGRGIEHLIDVASRIRDSIFLVVGGLEIDNSYYRQLVTEKGLGNFIFTGHVPHNKVARYLKASDVLVMPYTREMTIKGGTEAAAFTSPIKLFEYMAAEKPIVATSLPTIREVIEDGKEALLVQPDSTEALYAGIKRILGDKRLSDKLAASASSRVREYTWEKRVERILNGL